MKTSRFLFCSLTAILPLISAPVRAGSNRSTGSGPDHAMVTQIVADAADGVAYAVTYGAGIYKTTSGGQRWRSANEGLLISSGVTALVETDDAMTLFAANGDGVYVSADGAEHWSYQGRPDVFGPASVLAFDSLSRTLYAGSSSHSGVFHSVDGGRTWQHGSGPNYGITRSLAISPNGVAYAVHATFPPAAGETLGRSVD